MSTAEADIHQTMANTMSPAEKARADAIMKGWLGFNAQAMEVEAKFAEQSEEIASEVDALVCKKLGLDESPAGDRHVELGRLLSDLYRTYQMRMPYAHQMNDALIKEHLKTFDFALQRGILPDIVAHDVESMQEILGERVYWVEQTGDINLALDAVITPTCFRNLTIGDGFQWHGPGKVSWISPYQRVLEKGWKRNIWTEVTEQKIFEMWTRPRLLGYAGILECHFDIPDWDAETRMISIEVSPLA